MSVETYLLISNNQSIDESLYEQFNDHILPSHHLMHFQLSLEHSQTTMQHYDTRFHRSVIVSINQSASLVTCIDMTISCLL